MADPVSVPNAFAPNTKIKSAEVNANFAALIAYLNARLGAASGEGQIWISNTAGKATPHDVTGDFFVGPTGSVYWTPEIHFAGMSAPHDLLAHNGSYNDVGGLSFTATTSGRFLVIASIDFFLGLNDSDTVTDPNIICRARLHSGFTVTPGEADFVSDNLGNPAGDRQSGASAVLVTWIDLAGGQTAQIQAIIEATLGATLAQVTTASTLVAIRVAPASDITDPDVDPGGGGGGTTGGGWDSVGWDSLTWPA